MHVHNQTVTLIEQQQNRYRWVVGGGGHIESSSRFG
jgi:hypothetical protein